MARIDLLFDALLQAGGSDLHLGVGYPPLMRQRGDLVEMREELITQEEMESLLFEIASPEQKKTIVENLDLDFAYAYGDKRALPRELLLQDDGAGGGLPHHPDQGPHARRPAMPAVHPQAVRAARRAWCSSRGRRARASRPRSPR